MGGRGANYRMHHGERQASIDFDDGTHMRLMTNGRKTIIDNGASLAGQRYTESNLSFDKVLANAQSMGARTHIFTTGELKAQARQREADEHDLDNLFVRGAGTPRHGWKGH